MQRDSYPTRRTATDYPSPEPVPTLPVAVALAALPPVVMALLSYPVTTMAVLAGLTLTVTLARETDA